MLTQLAEGTQRFTFDRVESIRVARVLKYHIRYLARRWDGSYGPKAETYHPYSREDFERSVKNFETGEWKRVGIVRECLYRIRPILKDADSRLLSDLYITEAELPKLFKGEVIKDVSRLFMYEWGSWTSIEFPNDTMFRRVMIAFPIEILKAAVHRARRLSRDKDWDGTVNFRLSERHLGYFQPKVRIEYHGEAQEIYERNQNQPGSYSGSTLKDLVENLINTARNCSASQGDPVTLNLSKDGPESLYFWFVREKTGSRTAYNGAILWNGDHYSTHT